MRYAQDDYITMHACTVVPIIYTRVDNNTRLQWRSIERGRFDNVKPAINDNVYVVQRTVPVHGLTPARTVRLICRRTAAILV